MQSSNALTASAIAMGLLSFTLSSTPIKTPTAFLSYPTEVINQTTSVCLEAKKYITAFTLLPELSPREEALAFFEDQKEYSNDEIATYWKVLESKSINTGINIFDFF